MTAFPSTSELGRIVSASGYSYQIKPDDVLWLARAALREGGDNAATVWTYFQRQVLYRRTSPLALLVQAHSQAVNPTWRRDGEHCRPGGDFYGRPECSERLLAARDVNASRTWGEIPASLQQLIVDAAQGKLPNNVPRATDFADQVQGNRFLQRHTDSRLVLNRGNIYIAEGGAVGWPDGFVRVEYAGRTSRESPAPASSGLPGWFGPVLGLGTFLGSAGVTWLFLRRGR